MKQFLCVSRRADELTVELADRPELCLMRPGGRASPIFGVDPAAARAALPPTGTIAFLLPRSPQVLISRLINDCEEWVTEATYLSHGLASVVLLSNRSEAIRELVDGLNADLLLGWELWPLDQGSVSVSEIEIRRPETPRQSWPDPISDLNLSFGVAAQVRQFNANIALLIAHCDGYGFQYTELIRWLCRSVALIADQHRQLLEEKSLPDEDISRMIGLETHLVELNAELTLFISQVSSGSLPIYEGCFPVGEYSLLGISGMVNAVWRIYSHLQRTFASFDHVGRIQNSYSSTTSFDPYAPSNRRNYTIWQDLAASVAQLPAAGDSDEGRIHIPHFSSRWGFHESYYGMSTSWQCLHSSATREWNLLTLTHEFIHSHIRDILGELMDIKEDPGSLGPIVAKYNRRLPGENARESMQLALLEALVGIRGAARLAARYFEVSASTQVEVPPRLKVQDCIELMRTHGGYVHELLVHVLDFLYIYDGQDDRYIESVWSSWSLVPAVNDRIDHYVLRSLCTLSVTADPGTPSDVFQSCRGRLTELLEPMRRQDWARPAIDAALALLSDIQWQQRLDVEMRAARYVVEVARHFFYDPRLNAALVSDPGTTVRDEKRTYSLSVGEFRGEEIVSPVGFLLDRMGSYGEEPPGVDAEYESLWQMLVLT